MANNEHINKVVKSTGETLIDLTSDTVTPSTLLQDVTAHDRSGAQIKGAVIVAPTDVTETEDNTAYLYKNSEHDAVYDELVGGSVAWNQLVQNGNFESTSGWSGVRATISAANNTLTLVAVGSQVYTGIQRAITQILANHVILASYDYDASSISNFWRTVIQLRTGLVYTAYGSKTESKGTNSFLFKHTSTPDAIQIIFNKNTNFTSTDTITVKNFYCVDLTQMFGTTIADYVYNLEQSTAGSGIAWLKSYGFFTKDYYAYNAGVLISTNTYGKKVVSETTEITYPIQSTDLRGLYKLNGNKLYTDGDIYSADGTVTRKYGYRGYQSGDESLANAITDGTYTIYKLSTPTTETAQPFTSPQMVYRNGTEEYLDTRDVPIPVGGNRKYVDIPEWMVNQYFDDVRAEASTALPLSGGTMTGPLEWGDGVGGIEYIPSSYHLIINNMLGDNGKITISSAGKLVLEGHNEVKLQSYSGNFVMGEHLFYMNLPDENSENLQILRMTYGSGSELVIDGSGYVGKSSSSRDIKHDIQYIEDTESYHDALMQIKPATYIYNNDKTETTKLGMIAEDIADVMPIAALTGKDGKVENYDTRAVIAMLVMEVQRLNAEIERLRGDSNAD